MNNSERKQYVTGKTYYKRDTSPNRYATGILKILSCIAEIWLKGVLWTALQYWSYPTNGSQTLILWNQKYLLILQMAPAINEHDAF